MQNFRDNFNIDEISLKILGLLQENARMSYTEIGQKIGAIEAMKIIKDVVAVIKGKVVKVCVKNGQSVEYGQELFLVDTASAKK